MPRWRQRGSVPLCPANINKGATSPVSTGCMRDPWDLLRNADRSGLEPPCRQHTAFGRRIPTAMRKRNGNPSSLHQFAGQQFGKHLINHTPPFGKNTIDLSDSAIGGFFEQYAMAGLPQARTAG